MSFEDKCSRNSFRPLFWMPCWKHLSKQSKNKDMGRERQERCTEDLNILSSRSKNNLKSCKKMRERWDSRGKRKQGLGFEWDVLTYSWLRVPVRHDALLMKSSSLQFKWRQYFEGIRAKKTEGRSYLLLNYLTEHYFIRIQFSIHYHRLYDRQC